MNKNGLRRIFSLLLAVMMVCALLPTAAFAEDVVEPQDENGDVAAYANSSVPVKLTISSYSWPFINGNTGEHTEVSYKLTKYVNQSDVGSDNASGSATARFVGSNETGWTLVVDLVVGNYTETLSTNARITNKDMSAATGTVTFGLSFNTAGGTSAYISISGGKDLPTPPQPDKPTKPTAEDVKALLGNAVVKIFCGTAGSGVHPAAAYPLKDGSFTVGDVNSSGDIPTCDITVNAQPYVEDYNTKYTGHTLSTADHTPKVITLEYDSSTRTWSPKTPLPIIFNVVCDTAPSVPEQATKDDVLGANIKVTIVCDNTDVNHGSKDFDLIEDAIKEISAPRQSSVGTYICDVTISSESYVPQFDQDKKATHTPPAATKKITLSYVDGKWIAPSIDTAYPHVNFTVRCGTKPAAPNHDELSKLIGDITVNCTSGSATHTPKSEGYALINGSYTTSGVEGDAENGYTYTVTIKSGKYVNQFDIDTGAAHTPKDGEATVVLEYKDKAWAVKRGTPVSFNVACVAEIAPPTFDELKAIFNQNIHVACKTKSAHTDTPYDLIEGSYSIEDFSTATDYPTCTVVLNSREYVKLYSSKDGTGVAHAPENEVKRITLYRTENGWTATDNAFPIVFRVECEELYTVTYTDGVDGVQVFEDQVYKDLASGTDTPTFKGTPKREGYKFAGWEPEVAKTVTENAVYTAQWEKVEQTFTVTYKDGVKGKAFKEQVYKDLIYGVDTPEFSGKPTRKGYTFAGWTPKVTDTVTKDVTYTATWKSNSGKDNVPKTGDGEIVMILGSVLLFSFCGAAAVCVFDRKRKQG